MEWRSFSGAAKESMWARQWGTQIACFLSPGPSRHRHGRPPASVRSNGAVPRVDRQAPHHRPRAADCGSERPVAAGGWWCRALSQWAGCCSCPACQRPAPVCPRHMHRTRCRAQERARLQPPLMRHRRAQHRGVRGQCSSVIAACLPFPGSTARRAPRRARRHSRVAAEIRAARGAAAAPRVGKPAPHRTKTLSF